MNTEDEPMISGKTAAFWWVIIVLMIFVESLRPTLLTIAGTYIIYKISLFFISGYSSEPKNIDGHVMKAMGLTTVILFILSIMYFLAIT